MASEEKKHNGSLIPKSPATQSIDKELIELEKELGQVEEKILAALGIEMEEFIREKMFTKLSKKSDRRPDPLKEDKKREKKRLEIDIDDSIESDGVGSKDSESEQDASEDVSEE